MIHNTDMNSTVHDLNVYAMGEQHENSVKCPFNDRRLADIQVVFLYEFFHYKRTDCSGVYFVAGQM